MVLSSPAARRELPWRSGTAGGTTDNAQRPSPRRHRGRTALALSSMIYWCGT